MYLKRVGLLVLMLAALQLSTCKSVNGIQQDTYYEVGGIKLYPSDGLNETKTGTKMTDAIEQLLYDKYGEEFVCEQYLYYEEFSLLCNYTAYPKSNPDVRFRVDVTGKDKLSIWHDQYFNVLCKDAINDFVYPAVKPYGIARDHFYIDHMYMITSKDISKETFHDNQFSVYIGVSKQELEGVKNQMKQILTDIYNTVQSGSDFYVYLIDDSVNYPENFSYDSVWQTYDVDWNNSKDKLQVRYGDEVWEIATALPETNEP